MHMNFIQVSGASTARTDYALAGPPAHCRFRPLPFD
jgi:hypothetical protein